MLKKKNYIASGLTKKSDLYSTARIVLDIKLFNLITAINLFFKLETVENLHSVRIALRRVRYSLEIFTLCFDKKKYNPFYKKLERLQDLSGSARDLDVLTDNMIKLQNEEKIKISKKIFSSIEMNKNNLKDKLKLELMQFLHGKALRDFQLVLKGKN